uniref:Uncharacterized protein n=1 Tax=Timema cristinae TaxID=61476 RepID=A0A7R9CRU2_TIMCR|nr:unnamed protein product [Timema cristinae]
MQITISLETFFDASIIWRENKWYSLFQIGIPTRSRSTTPLVRAFSPPLHLTIDLFCSVRQRTIHSCRARAVLASPDYISVITAMANVDSEVRGKCSTFHIRPIISRARKLLELDRLCCDSGLKIGAVSQLQPMNRETLRLFTRPAAVSATIQNIFLKLNVSTSVAITKFMKKTQKSLYETVRFTVPATWCLTVVRMRTKDGGGEKCGIARLVKADSLQTTSGVGYKDDVLLVYRLPAGLVTRMIWLERPGSDVTLVYKLPAGLVTRMIWLERPGRSGPFLYGDSRVCFHRSASVAATTPPIPDTLESNPIPTLHTESHALLIQGTNGSFSRMSGIIALRHGERTFQTFLPDLSDRREKSDGKGAAFKSRWRLNVIDWRRGVAGAPLCPLEGGGGNVSQWQGCVATNKTYLCCYHVDKPCQGLSAPVFLPHLSRSSASLW